MSSAETLLATKPSASQSIGVDVKNFQSAACLAFAAGVAGILGSAPSAQAYVTVTGLDVNCPASINPPNPVGCTQTARPFGDVDNAPRIPFPKSTIAANQFLDILAVQGANTFGTEDFDNAGQFPDGANPPYILNFPGITNPTTVTATLGQTSTDTEINRIVSPGTDGNGRYPISGQGYINTDFGTTGGFVITFNRLVSAIGFYGVDIGDFGGVSSITLSNTAIPANTTTFPVVPASFFIPPNGTLSGSVTYFGVAATSDAQQFNRVTFNFTDQVGDLTDRFAFDNFTVGTRLVPAPVPLLGAGFAFAWSRKLRKRIKQSKAIQA
jgi:hypothetical protein